MKPTASRSRRCSSRSGRLAAPAAAVALSTLAVAFGSAQEPPPQPAGARQDVGQDVRQIVIGQAAQRFALPDCVPRRDDEASREACRVIARVLREDLRFEGLFQFVPEGLMEAIPPQSPDAPNFEDWRSIGAGVLVATRVEATGSELLVEARVFFVETGQTMLAKRYSGPIDNPRVFAHQASDDIVALAQHQGVARTKIVFTSDRDSTRERRSKELYIMDYDGYNPRRVTVNGSLNILPNWSPDGRSIVYVSYRRGLPQLFMAYIYEGRSSSNLSNEPESGQSFAPEISPDGSRVAFASSRSGNMEIWSAAVDGTGLRRLTTSAASDIAPTWSPTGREIAFTSSRGGTPQIYVMDAEGLNLRRLTTVGNHNDSPAWNPSRQFSEVAFTSRIEGRFEIAIVELGSRQVRQITQGRGSCEYPAWAPSGRHLVFACSQGGRKQIAIADREGRSFRFLPAGPGNNEQPDWGPMPR